MNTWFTSDLHLNHANIIRYCNRPFIKPGDLTERGQWVSREISRERCNKMNEVIISNWNARVKPNDTVFHIGDFCFNKSTEGADVTTKSYDLEKKLNGKIIFLYGNHDRNNGCKSLITHCVIKLGGKYLYMTHNPKFYNNDYEINLVGHVHDMWIAKKVGANSVAINVGVDAWSFKPIEINEILKVYNYWINNNKPEWIKEQ